MRKHISVIAFLLMLFVGLPALAQNNANDVYFVTVIKGRVTKADKAPLKVGEKLRYRDKVIFSGKDDMVVLLHPEKGRFVVTPAAAAEDASGGFFAFLSDNLHLQSHRVSLSSRGEPPLIEFFTANPTINENILIIGETKRVLTQLDYPVSNPDKDFYFLQYTTPEGKAINNMLHVTKDTFSISKEDFLFNGNYPAAGTEVKLGFAADKNYKKIISFKPVFMTVQECKDFLLTIKNLKSKKKDDIIEEAVTELYYFYGKPDKNTVEKIYNSLK